MISCIIPDDCRPWYEDEKGVKHYADIVANPASIIGRKNVSQLHEAWLSRAIDKLREEAIEVFKSDDDAAKEQLLGKVKAIYGRQKAELDMDGLKAMADGRRDAWSINVGTFHENAYDYVKNICDMIGVGEAEEVYMPSVSMKECSGENGEYGFKVKSIDDGQAGFPDGDDFELGWLDQPITLGVNFYMKLYHSATWSGSATSGRKTKETDTVMGKGKVRSTGQSIGEMESWAMHALGTDKLVEMQSPTFETHQGEFFTQLAMLGAMLRVKH